MAVAGYATGQAHAIGALRAATCPPPPPLSGRRTLDT